MVSWITLVTAPLVGSVWIVCGYPSRMVMPSACSDTIPAGGGYQRRGTVSKRDQFSTRSDTTSAGGYQRRGTVSKKDQFSARSDTISAGGYQRRGTVSKRNQFSARSDTIPGVGQRRGRVMTNKREGSATAHAREERGVGTTIRPTTASRAE
eukprot:4445861-Pyramimonas_sp.AAC.1